MENYNCIDLDVIKKEISDFAYIEEAKSFILNESVNFNPLVIKKNIKETSEALKILNEGNIISFDGILCLDDIFDKADKNLVLSGIELNKCLTLHNHSERIKRQFTKFSVDLSIRDYTDAIMIENGVFEKVSKCIDNTGEVKSDASDKLRSIYKELERNENQLLEKARRFISTNSNSLQESQIYQRNGRVAFLVKNVDKNKYGGFSYGPSSSLQAHYVEPQMFVELNNKKLQLEEDKNREIEIILTNLTYLISSVSDKYRENFNSLMQLNVIFSKANYGLVKHATMGQISSDGLMLKDICHPLIPVKDVVSNSYSLKDPYVGIVISGSNTGGKTVSLKLIGLAVVLTYLGIPLICEEAYIPLFDNVYIDIDDNQSIMSSLSTFSAHITNINEILKKSTSNSLILIDELISGTDPKQAQAISLAIIEKMEKIGSRFVITTHFDDIKNYAYEDERILLSSVSFDLKKLKPTYKYIENSVGSSNAFEIATRYFDDEEIISRAKEIMALTKSSQEEMMDKLSLEVAKNISLKEELDKKNQELSLKQKELDDKIKAFDKEKENIRNQYIEKMNKYIDEKMEKADEIIESIKEKEDVKKVKEIEELFEEDKPEIEDRNFEVGNTVTVGDNEEHATITEISGNNVVVNLRGISVRTKLEKLHKVHVQVKPKPKKTFVKKNVTSNVSHELNIVGERVEEGLIILENYLDSAYAANYSTVKIIHGIGTGALRKAVHDKLKKLKFISKYHFGDFHDGGSAVTIVEFKK